MKLPKMIIFDYGHTLLSEPDWNAKRGDVELLKYAIHNPNNYTADDIEKAVELIWGYANDVRKIGYDINAQVVNKTLYEYLDIKLSLSPLQAETVFWDAASNGAVMPSADIMIDYINENDIRSAVISNIAWSGEALKQRIDRLLPNNKFEFVMASSDYFVRKPNRVLFDIALNKAGLEASEVWYCGDSIDNDIFGANNVGITPVWYNSEKNLSIPQCEHLKIENWKEFIEILELIKRGK